MTEGELEALRLSLRVGLIATGFVVPVALLAALALRAPRWPGRTLFDLLVHLPLVLPPVVLGYGLLLLLGRQGAIGSILEAQFGIRLVFTAEGAALAAGLTALPLAVRALRLGFAAIDPGLIAAARALGASRLGAFTAVELPLLAPSLLGAAILAFTASLGEFGATITFAANVAGETRTLPLAIWTALQTPGGDAAAARLVLVSLAVAVVGLAVSEGLARSALRRVGRAA